MSIDQYKVSLPSSFEKYYDLFLQNIIQGKRYRISLTDGSSKDGTPTCASFVNPLNPKVSFNFKTISGEMYRIPFSALAKVEKLSTSGTVISGEE